ncbi:MAG: DUF58 domain-containing protein [Candidatus Omnitrophica bacterium]|nr:DUF58 domain-containing protein [Candidatus Omnitrophota bacterium]
MLPKEIIKKIRRIEIKTSRLVTDVFSGQYQSTFKGKGMEFDEVREYLPGDEIRSIDWNVTARMGHPYIKKYVEERELTVMLLLDASASCRFGTAQQLKSELAAELCSVLAFSAIKNNDRVGLLIFTDQIEAFVPPRKGLRHVLRVIREALYYKPRGRGTDISRALDYLNTVIRKKSVCFLISDFMGPAYAKRLQVCNKHHDVIAVTVSDPREVELPAAGIMRIRDAETGGEYLIDSDSPVVRREYERESRRFFAERERTLRQQGVDVIGVRTDRSYAEALLRFFRTREKRLGV